MGALLLFYMKIFPRNTILGVLINSKLRFLYHFVVGSWLSHCRTQKNCFPSYRSIINQTVVETEARMNEIKSGFMHKDKNGIFKAKMKIVFQWGRTV